MNVPPPSTKITPTNIEKSLDNFSLLDNSGYFSPIFTFFKPEFIKKWAGEGLDKVWRFSSHFFIPVVIQANFEFSD